MVLINSVIDIAAISLAMAIVSRYLQHRFGKRNEMVAIQAQMKEKQKQIQELYKKGDEASKKKADKIQAEMMEHMNTMMSANMKVMMVSMVVFLPALWALSVWYSSAPVNLPFPFLIAHQGGPLFIWFEIGTKTSWLWWYISISLISSIVIGFVLKQLKIEK
ncbi:MAG: EMC3/TMCO1 family protein [Candidatus Micrarchaeota archaeon]